MNKKIQSILVIASILILLKILISLYSSKHEQKISKNNNEIGLKKMKKLENDCNLDPDNFTRHIGQIIGLNYDMYISNDLKKRSIEERLKLDSLLKKHFDQENSVAIQSDALFEPKIQDANEFTRLYLLPPIQDEFFDNEEIKVMSIEELQDLENELKKTTLESLQTEMDNLKMLKYEYANEFQIGRKYFGKNNFISFHYTTKIENQEPKVNILYLYPTKNKLYKIKTSYKKSDSIKYQSNFEKTLCSFKISTN